MDWMKETNDQLRRGAFLMVDGNPMTIGWGQFGIIWNKQTFSVYVRHSRYTYTLLKNASTFTISVPEAGAMKEELAFCGSLHIECRILFRTDLDEHLLEDPALVSRYYAEGDTHTMFIGEILGVYKENE